MAAPRVVPRENIRIRIKLDIDKQIIRTLSRKCWMLIQESPTLSTISDLQLQIVNRFNLPSNSIQLYLEHFLLPSWESVRILRENDLLSVQDIETIKNEACTQVMPELTDDTEEQQPDVQSCTEEQTPVEQTLKKKKKKRKRHHSESDNEVRTNKVTVKQKTPCLNVTGLEDEDQQGKESAMQALADQTEQCLVQAEMKQKALVTQLVVKRECLKQMEMDPLKECHGGGDGSVGTEEDVGDNTVKNRKKRRRRHKQRKPEVDTPTDADNNLTLNLPPPQTVVQRPVMLQKRAKNAQNGHVHFDSDKSEDEGQSVCDVVSNGVDHNMTTSALIGVQCPDTERSETLAPALSDTRNCQTGREGGQLVNGGGSGKVFYRGKPSSKALPSCEVSATVQKSETSPIVAVEVKVKDYSVYDLLHGPPRPGDKIAYKLLELSEAYNPEVSAYKEAQVISYDPATQTLEVERLGTPTVERKPGKFDLIVEDDNEILTTTEEDILKVTLSWPSVIEPRLLT